MWSCLKDHTFHSQLHYSANSYEYARLLLTRKYTLNNTRVQEKESMSNTLKQIGRTQAPAIQVPLLKKEPQIPGRVRGTIGTPKVLIQGDIRLRVTESYAAGRPVKGYYRLEMEGMQEPLQVIWIIEGTVLNHTVLSIEVEFDVRGIPAGETLTRMFTAQVTDKNGQGCIVHSSVFIQIFAVRDDLRRSNLVLNTISL
jgi:hypothetical protein